MRIGSSSNSSRGLIDGHDRGCKLLIYSSFLASFLLRECWTRVSRHGGARTKKSIAVLAADGGIIAQHSAKWDPSRGLGVCGPKDSPCTMGREDDPQPCWLIVSLVSFTDVMVSFPRRLSLDVTRASFVAAVLMWGASSSKLTIIRHDSKGRHTFCGCSNSSFYCFCFPYFLYKLIL